MTNLDHMIESDARDMVPRASWRETAAVLVTCAAALAFFAWAFSVAWSS